MRLVSFIILDGGAGREQALLELIRQQGPDLLALVEAEDRDVVDYLPVVQTVNRAAPHPARDASDHFSIGVEIRS